MIEDSIQRIQTTSEYCLREQKHLDEYDEARKVLADNSFTADNYFFSSLCEELTRQDVISEPIWSLRVKPTQDDDMVIELILPDDRSTFFKHLKRYAETKGFWFDFQQYTISSNPKIYLYHGGINFSGLVSWEDQLRFLKENNVRFDTSKAWENPKGIKRKLRQLDSLYD